MTAYDTTENETAAPYLPPQGHYDAKATSWCWEKSKAGETYLALLFAFTAPGEDGNNRNWTCRGALFFGEKPDAKGRMPWQKSLDVLRAMGLDGDDLSVIDENVGPIGEGAVDIEVEHEAYTDRDGNDRVALKAKWINPPQVAKTLTARNAPEAHEKQSFMQQMKARIRAAEMAQKASGVQRTNAPAQTHQPVRPAPSAPAQARAATANANASAGNQARPSGGQTRTQAPARNQPPPRMQGQAMGEFQGADDDIPF